MDFLALGLITLAILIAVAAFSRRRPMPGRKASHRVPGTPQAYPPSAVDEPDTSSARLAA